MSTSRRFLSLNPYELHKHLINTYVLNRKGDTSLLRRDTSRDRTDSDVIRENHKFIWEDDEQPYTWEERLAKKYYDKLYKEFCISDLSRYKENMIAMRWQTEKELITGKGQFICGNKICQESEDLKSWEVNFGYVEHGEMKNALVKLRLCTSCSKKLNHKHRRKEIKRLKRHKGDIIQQECCSGSTALMDETQEGISQGEITSDTDLAREMENEESEIWKKPVEETQESSRDEEFEKYLEHLLL